VAKFLTFPSVPIYYMEPGCNLMFRFVAPNTVPAGCRSSPGMARSAIVPTAPRRPGEMLRRGGRDEAKDVACVETGDGAAVRVLTIKDDPTRYRPPPVAHPDLPTVAGQPSLYRSAVGERATRVPGIGLGQRTVP
jgi:hypothetical protein